MKKTLSNALEIKEQGGAVLASEWITGSYARYISKRPIPVHCKEITVDKIDALKGETRRTALRLIKRHHRAKKLIVLIDRRKLNADIQE